MRYSLISLLFISALSAADGDEFFESRIRPVLAEKCYGCHSAKLREPKANLQLDSRAALRKGGDSGPVIVPGKPGESRLWKAVSYTDFHLRMPPTGKLPANVLDDIKTWIEMGAPDPRQETAVRKGPASIDLEKGRRFWAFQPLLAAPAALVKNAAWPRAAIDHYLLAALEQKGLAPAAETSRPVWLRRVTFDLTGLPPTPDELAAFEADGSPNAHAKVVDRLLASPHYGERWGRHWLDLVRFAETNGHEYDNNKLDAWQYRDYVIRAFNEDVPYNTFVREHLAGDLFANPRLSKDGSRMESPLGTNFLWFGEVLNSATDSAKSRADTVDNQLDVIGKTFLGLTLACARCHDHKFDPLPTADYYGMAGILHSTSMREAVIDSPSRAAAIRAAHAKAAPVTRNPGKSRFVLRPGDEVWEDFNGTDWGGWYASGEAFSAGPRAGVADSAGRGANELVGSLTSKKFRMPKRWVHIRLNATKGDNRLIEREPVRVTLVADDYKSIHYLGSGKGEFEWVSHRMTLPFQRMCYFEIVDRSRTGNVAVDAIVFSDDAKPPQTETTEAAEWREPAPLPVPLPESNFGMIAWDEAPQDVRLHIRGNHQNLGENVPRHFLQVLWRSPEPPQLEGSSGRPHLAQWLTTDAAHLLARVYVNRVWKHHFGHGLVRTTDNFGLTGERPSHKELLDHLASRFIAGGWSTKQLHREILLSAAYRMTSRANDAAKAADPRNDLLHHFPVRRLEAESVRDAMLAVSGSLNPQLGGPSIVPHISRYQDGRGKPKSGPLDGDGRRSIYIEVRRNFLTPLFLAFDYPLPISTIGARGTSTVPSQALILLNNELVLQQAGKWAEKVEKEAAAPEARVTRLFQQAFARSPEKWEVDESLAFLRQGRPLADLAHVLFNSAEFLYVQ